MSLEHTRRVNAALKDLGAQDARAGKPIEAFYEIKTIRLNERNRATYEIGYRAEKDLMRKAARRSGA